MFTITSVDSPNYYKQKYIESSTSFGRVYTLGPAYISPGSSLPGTKELEKRVARSTDPSKITISATIQRSALSLRIHTVTGIYFNLFFFLSSST